MYVWALWSTGRHIPCSTKQPSGEPIGYVIMIRRVVVCVVLSGLLHWIPSSSKFVAGPGTVGGDVNQSAALEWTLDKVPGNYYFVEIIFKGHLVFQYTPYTGGITSSWDPRFSIYNTTTKGVGFRLEPLLPDDAGNYTCELFGFNKEDENLAMLLVHDVPTNPTIAETLGDYVEGETDVTLTCTATSTSLPVAYRPAMLYMWRRNGVDIDRTAPPERHAVLGDGGQTLEISPINHTDTTYTCTASESGTQLTSVETQVTLDVLYGPLNISIHPENPTLAFNETLVLTAYATCHPTCDFEWQRGSDVISLNSTLTLHGSEISSSETYEVTADNDYGNLNFIVTVTYIPGEVPDEPTTTAWTTVTNPNGNSSPADPGAEDDPDDNTVIIIAVSVVLAMVVIATIVIVAIVLVRKRKSKENGTEEFDELTPYVTVSRPTENVTDPGSQPGNLPGNRSGNRSGNSPQADGDPLSGQPHPDVIPPIIYAEVIKKTKGAGSSSKPTVNGNTKQRPPKVTPPDVYAEKTTGAGSSSKPTLNRRDDTKPAGKPPPTTKKPKLRERPPPIAPPKVPDMDQSGLGITNAAFESTADDMTPWEHTYCNTSGHPTNGDSQLRGDSNDTYGNTPAPPTISGVLPQGESEDKGQSPEGITYADIAFGENGNVNNDVVRREVEPTEYATLALRHAAPVTKDG